VSRAGVVGLAEYSGQQGGQRGGEVPRGCQWLCGGIVIWASRLSEEEVAVRAFSGGLVLNDLSIHQIVHGGSWGAVKDMLLVSYYYYYYFIVIYLPSPFPTNPGETKNTVCKCHLQWGQACKADGLPFVQAGLHGAIVPPCGP